MSVQRRIVGHKLMRASLLILIAAIGGMLIASGCGLFSLGLLLGIKQPDQPLTGPGSSDYGHSNVAKSFLGDGLTAYYIFEPADPQPATAPVVVFMHGYGATSPNTYAGWINHIVRKGNIVIYPVYQTALDTPPAEYTPSALAAVVDAYQRLGSEGHVGADPTKLAFVGHSAGGVLAANLAAEAGQAGLPAPRAVLLAHASDVREGGWFDFQGSLLDAVDYSRIADDALMLGIIANGDLIASDAATRTIFDAAPQIPSKNKEILVHYADSRGWPVMKADHFSPASYLPDFVSESGLLSMITRSGSLPDAVDYLGYWKWLDALIDTAFEGGNRKYAFGGTAEQTFMGQWSDGTPVRQAEVIAP